MVCTNPYPREFGQGGLRLLPYSLEWHGELLLTSTPTRQVCNKHLCVTFTCAATNLAVPGSTRASFRQ